jgi:hypothetical protein
MLVTLLFWSLATLCCGFAARYGGRSGMRVASAIILALIATTLLPDGNRWVAPNLWALAVDSILLTALVQIAARSDRWFPVWTAGLQLLGVTSHLGSIFARSFAPDVYFLLQAFWVIPMLLTLPSALPSTAPPEFTMSRTAESSEGLDRTVYRRACDQLLWRLDRARAALGATLRRTEAQIIQVPVAISGSFCPGSIPWKMKRPKPAPSSP